MPNRVEGYGPLEPDLMAIGEAPGAREDEQEIPFAGPTGQMINEMLGKAGTSRHATYLTNVIKYRPPLNDLKKLHLIGVSIDESVKELWENEINVLKPKCILAIGDLALEATTGLTGILNYRGSILTAKDGITKVVPTIHPAALFSRAATEDEEAKGGLDWTWIKCIEADIARAYEESKSRDLTLPSRELYVAQNSLDVHRFFREYERMDKAAMDIESINCIPVCIGFAFNKHHALSIPLLSHIGKHRLTDMAEREMDEVWRTVDRELRRLKLVGHNLKYDEYKLDLMGFRCPTVYSDTLIKTRVIFPELPNKKLFVVSSLWTREPFYKDEGKEFKIGKQPIERFFKYNARDCAVEWEVDEEQEKDLLGMEEKYGVPLRDYYYNYQMKKHKFYLKMENVGFAVNFERQKELKIKYTAMQEEVHKRLTERLGYELNVKSYPQVFELLYKVLKFKLRTKNPTSEDVIVALLGQAKKKEQKDVLLDVLEERRIRDQKSRAIMFVPDYDNTCKTTYNVIATETCRSSTGILKKPLRPKKLGLSFHTIPAHGRLAKDVKSMFVPRKGKCFIKADSSQAEPRCVAVLSKDWELLKAFEDKVDVHRRTAGLIFAYTQKLELAPNFTHPIVDYLDKDGPERFCGKKTRNAGNYRMGPRRFMTEFNTDAQKFDIGMTISEWRAKQMLKLFNDASPKLNEVFHFEVEEAIKSTRTLIDPFGGVRVFNGRMDDETFKEGYANLPQRIVGHVVQGAALKIEDELNGDDVGYFIGEKHDELIMEVPEHDYMPYAALLKKHMEVPIDFSTCCTLKRDFTLVIPCEVEVSNTHYGDFRKVKM